MTEMQSEMPKQKSESLAAKVEVPNDHPMIAAGFWPETLVFELWPYGVEYREKFLRRNKIPYRTIKGTRWFFRDDLLAWLRSGESNSEPEPPRQ